MPRRPPSTAEPRSVHARWALVLLAFAASCTPAASAQQEPGLGADEAQADGPASDAYSASEVAAVAQQVTTSLYRLRARVHHVRDLEHHLVLIDALGAEEARLRVDSDLDTLESQPRRELRNLREQWTELDARLEETAETLATAAAALERDGADVRATSERWERTAAAATRGEGYPDAARARIAEVRALLSEVDEELRAQLEQLLTAQTRLATYAIDTGDVLAQLDHAIEVSQGRLLSPTSEPGLGAMRDAERMGIGAQLEAAAVHHLHSLDRFATHLGGRGYLHAILALGLLVFLYWLRREQRPEAPPSAQERGGSAADALRHPVAMTIFAALLLLRPLHPLAPRAVVELAQLLAIGPLLMVGVGPRQRTVTRVVAALYAMDWVRLLFDEHQAEHRVLLVATAFVAAVGFSHCARGTDGPARAAWGIASLGAASGLVACLAGYVPLSSLLVEGVVASAFIAVALMAFHRALMGWVDAALTTRFAQSTVLGRHAAVTRQSALRASRLGLGILWGWVALDYFNVRGAFMAQLGATLSESVQLGELAISVGEILAFFGGIWAAVVVSRILARTLQEDLAPRLGMGPGVPAAAALVVRYTVLALGFFLAASAAGIGLAQLSLFAGALGVGVGFGLQNIVSNFVSGLLLVFERPVKVGDTVDIEGRRGVITAIGVRSSTVRALNGADVVIPNSKLIESALVNWTHDDATIRVDFPIGVAYGTDVRVAHEVLLGAASALPAALPTPAPSVLLTGFGDSSIDFQVRVWVGSASDEPAARSALGFAIHQALEDAAIEIPFPQRVVHMQRAE